MRRQQENTGSQEDLTGGSQSAAQEGGESEVGTDTLCVVCCERGRDAILLPCAHQVKDTIVLSHLYYSGLHRMSSCRSVATKIVLIPVVL